MSSVDELIISLTIDQQDELKQLLNLLRTFKRVARQAAKEGTGLGQLQLTNITDMLEVIQERIKLITPMFLGETTYEQMIFAETLMARVKDLPSKLDTIVETLVARKGEILKGKYGVSDIEELKHWFKEDLQRMMDVTKAAAHGTDVNKKFLIAFDDLLSHFMGDPEKGITEFSNAMKYIREDLKALERWTKGRKFDVMFENIYSKLPEAFFKAHEKNAQLLEETLTDLELTDDEIEEIQNILEDLRQQGLDEASRIIEFVDKTGIDYDKIRDLFRIDFVRSHKKLEAFWIMDILETLKGWKEEVAEKGLEGAEIPIHKIFGVKGFESFRNLLANIIGIDVGKLFVPGNRQRVDFITRIETLKQMVNELSKDMPEEMKKKYFESLKDVATLVAGEVEKAFVPGLREELEHQKDFLYKFLMFTTGGKPGYIREERLLEVPMMANLLRKYLSEDELEEAKEKAREKSEKLEIDKSVSLLEELLRLGKEKFNEILEKLPPEEREKLKETIISSLEEEKI